MPRQIFVLCAWGLLSWCLQLQAQQLKFSHFYVEDGLSHNTISSMVQDYQGFMWFSTFNGLNRFDGYSFLRYYHNTQDSTSLANSHIENIFEDSNHNLWIATADGLDLYERSTNSFIHFAYSNINPNKHTAIYAIAEGTDGKIWIGGFQGIGYVDMVSQKVKPFRLNGLSQEDLETVLSIQTDTEGNLFIGTRKGVGHISIADNSYTPIHFPEYWNDHRSISVNKIKKDKKGFIWVGTSAGVYTFDKTKNLQQVLPQIAHERVHDILIRQDNTIIIATENGLYHYSPVIGSLIHYQRDRKMYSLSDRVIRCVTEDSYKNLWIGTFYGLNYTGNFKSFQLLTTSTKYEAGLKNPYASALHVSLTNHLYVGAGNGIEIFDVSSDTIKNITSLHRPLSVLTEPVLAFSGDDNDNMVIVSWRSNIYWYQPANKKLTALPNPNPQVTPTIAASTSNTFWLGSNQNVYKINLDSLENTKVITLAKHSINFLYEDTKHNLWIGAQPDLIHFNTKTVEIKKFKKNKSDSTSLNANIIYAMYEDDKGVYWIGTDQGLFRFHDNKFTSIALSKSYADHVKAIVEDTNGNLWLATNNGICRFSKTTHALRRFSVADGLQGKEFFSESAIKFSNGKMAFGGTKGINLFFPDSIKESSIPPRVVITDFKVLNRPIPIDGKKLSKHISIADRLELDYTDSEFTFEFVAINFSAPEKNQYAYKLEGFDKDWNYIGARKFASYTNLPTGKSYTFRVKAANEDNVWNESGAFVQIYIHPPFWDTWWFKALLYCTVAGLVVLIFHIRSSVLRKQKELLQREVNLRTIELQEANEELKAQAEEIEQINEFLKQDNTKLEHDVKDLSEARIMQKSVSFQEFQKVYPDSDSCYFFIEQLKWGKGFVCKSCGNGKFSPGNAPFSRRCSKCNYIETITSNTIFSRIKFPITKAFYILFLLTEGKHYTLSELSQLVELRQQTCWTFKKRIEERTKNIQFQKNKDGWSHLILIS